MAHISNTEHSQIVALIFDTDEPTREALSHKLAPAIATELSTTVTPLTTDWISTNPTKTLRITLSTSSATPITLQHCTRLAHSPSIATLQTTLATQLILLPAAQMHLHAHPGLAVFDMDSTLIQQEVIDELARAVGKYAQVSAITDAAMRGEAPYTDFEASLRARVALLKGVPISIWDGLKEGTITFTPGGAELVRVLRALGWKTAVLSGGFMPLASWVKGVLGLDYAFANQLVEDEGSGTLTGELVVGAAIVHAERKRELLVELAAENGIPIEWTVAVGDGSNDLLMMHAAGLGMAFNAKPKVQAAAPTRLNGASLLSIAYMLGCTGRQVADVLKSAT
ncbi:Phosphoserine phosphatase [Friedmanniomyces endolithicus]|uniref:phosphoserine phosphatase n=1 Tax=Friedmanniomyces endolithicus TaxID=329885 RepID=A0AAN6K776_9PEZI|nr:Phosphoserine phosphatase [Friedmanniomyces endolithicus]KAK0776210.1 Phosphoserine phosphatase [Friedmanniomyces endolithicus]KAK0778631.1 Phosphoserine phosphatase [Friedmanniomyces endolithicus]KAK0807396.1 Phosphoserine phosphatase [Friedmanniomyces endolithicus]KAK0831974.1 Phosphoserine phosphatase [Friedmanniomyces endolithicus]